MPAEETTRAIFAVDVNHGGYDARPRARVFPELGIGGLEEDFDSVEGGNHGFGLR